jgi:hypothetical protein
LHPCLNAGTHALALTWGNSTYRMLLGDADLVLVLVLLVLLPLAYVCRS